MSNQPGTIYLVSTPIGNLEDMSARALRVLTEVDLIAAEDTRHSAKLLRHFGIDTPVTAYHDHNEREKAQHLVGRVVAGENLALISDAGTPLVNDPGYHLVKAAREADILLVPIPGACAAITALSVSGLPTDKFLFTGFPPAKSVTRKNYFSARSRLDVTLIFYESPHRIVESLTDMREIFGSERNAVVARELTKKFETVRSDSLAELVKWIEGDVNQQKGEFVVLVQGVSTEGNTEVDADTGRLLLQLAEELPPKRAAAIVAEYSGLRKNRLYEYLLDKKV
ncbi:MAG: 16S rRNA (cytidine(1402)-2'-O)-methyltransferase [Acidiferrobacterales bacterium]